MTVFDTEIKDFQAQVTNASVGVLRGYLANADKVRVRGAEFDASARLNEPRSVYGASPTRMASTRSFPDAPPPLEETGGPQSKDISGSVLPGISKWAISIGGETAVARRSSAAPDGSSPRSMRSYRSWFSSSATFSRYLIVDGYALLNARVGFQMPNGWAVTLWSRNLLDKDYFELLTAAPGNTGLFVGQPGDPRTFGVSVRVAFRTARK